MYDMCAEVEGELKGCGEGKGREGKEGDGGMKTWLGRE